MKRLIEAIKKMKPKRWEPDWGNPDDIRRLVIKKPSKYLWLELGTWPLMLAGLLELCLCTHGYPAFVVHCKTEAFLNPDAAWVWHILPHIALLNGAILSGYVIYKGINNLRLIR